jgi:hypothetical protein
VDSATRIHVRRQIDAANRRKLGLPARKTVVRREHGDATRKWTDGEIVASLTEIARLEGCTVGELKQAAYRRHRAANPHCGLSLNALRPRLAAGIAGLPTRLA